MGRRSNRAARRPRALAALVACAALAGTLTTLALAAGYTGMKTGIYSATAKIPPDTRTSPLFKGGSFKISFRVTPATQTNRTIRNMAIGPVKADCVKPSPKPGVAQSFAVHTLSRETNFASL